MKRKCIALLSCIGCIGIAQFASAALITVNTVGVMNGNAKTIVDATGDSVNDTTYASTIGTAFANDTGGVWNFDGPSFNVNPGETVTLNYGASASNAEVLTVGQSAGDNINQGTVSGEATSGSTELGLGNDAAPRTFTPSKPLLSVGIFNTNRGDSSRTCALSVTYQDNTTATTSGGNGGSTYFHELSGTASNSIKSFTLTQSAFIRYDDLGFVVAPTSVPILSLVSTAAGQLGSGGESGIISLIGNGTTGYTPAYDDAAPVAGKELLRQETINYGSAPAGNPEIIALNINKNDPSLAADIARIIADLQGNTTGVTGAPAGVTVGLLSSNPAYNRTFNTPAELAANGNDPYDIYLSFDPSNAALASVARQAFLGIDLTADSGITSGAQLVGVAAVPEPTALGLISMSFGLLLRRRRRQQAKADHSGNSSY